MPPRNVTLRPSSTRNFNAATILLEPNATDLGLFILQREIRWPDWASRQLEISPSTLSSVKFLARRSRMRAVSSETESARRDGWRLKVSWLMEWVRHPRAVRIEYQKERGLQEEQFA